MLDINGRGDGIGIHGSRAERRGGSSDFNSMAEWQGEDGYSREAVELYFGAFL